MYATSKLSPARVVPLGEGYASSTVNTTIFRHHGLVSQGDYQFGAYYVSSTEIAVFRRNLRDNSIQTGALTGNFRTADVHNCISLGIDSRGFVHMAYDHHGNPLNYRRSSQPMDITTWSDPLPLTGQLEERVTYPYFIMRPDTGDLFLLYRYGGAGNGDACLKAYNPDTQVWSDLAMRFIKGMDQVPWTSNAYWNHPAFDSRGNLLLSWVWRVNQKASANADFIFNHNHGFAKSPDGIRWFTSHDVELSLPMTQVNSEIIWPTTPGATIANQCSSAVDSKDRLHIAVHGAAEPASAPQYQHIWSNGQNWQCNVLSERKTSFGLLTWDVPMSRPEILIDRTDRVYVIYRCDLTDQQLVAQRLDPPDYAPPGRIFDLWPKDLRNGEPIVDRIRWRIEGVLSLLIQRTTQPPLIAQEDLPPEPVQVVDWEFQD